jgi:hypothetical protein
MVFSKAASTAFIGVNWHGLFAEWPQFIASDCKLFMCKQTSTEENWPKNPYTINLALAQRGSFLGYSLLNTWSFCHHE